jgi:Anti-sigma factor NepR
MSSKPVPDKAPRLGGTAQELNSRRQTRADIFTDDVIGQSLKAHFDDIAKAPVPDRFLALLAELEAKEQGNGT